VTGLIGGFGRGKGYFVGARRHRHTPDLPSREPEIPLPTLSHDAPELFKAALQVVVAEERALDGPEDLTTETAAQIGLYAHPEVRTAEPLVTDRPPELLTPSPVTSRERGWPQGFGRGI
jgi:hypothetical protein